MLRISIRRITIRWCAATAVGEQERAAAGEHHAAAGEQGAAAGEHRAAAGEQRAAAGEQCAAAGEQGAGAGEQELMTRGAAPDLPLPVSITRRTREMRSLGLGRS